MSARVLGLAVLIAFALPQAAAAEQALVKAPEAQIHAGSDWTSPVVLVVPGNTALQVSDQPENGWRKVRLKSGKVGYVEEAVLEFPLPPAANGAGPGKAPAGSPSPKAAQGSPPAKLVPAPPVRKQIAVEVKDLDQFGKLVQEDLEVQERVKSLAARRSAGKTTMVVTAAAGLALILSSVVASNNTCQQGTFICTNTPKFWALFGAGAAVGSVGPTVGYFMMPSHDDVAGAVDLWNQRHPAQPLWMGNVPTREQDPSVVQPE